MPPSDADREFDRAFELAADAFLEASARRASVRIVGTSDPDLVRQILRDEAATVCALLRTLVRPCGLLGGGEPGE